MPLATSSAAYWICKARVAAKAAQDDFMSALAVLDEAERHRPQVILFTCTHTHTVGFYARQHVCYSASLRQRRVRLSVCHTPVLCLAERKQDRKMYTV